MEHFTNHQFWILNWTEPKTSKSLEGLEWMQGPGKLNWYVGSGWEAQRWPVPPIWPHVQFENRSWNTEETVCVEWSGFRARPKSEHPWSLELEREQTVYQHIVQPWVAWTCICLSQVCLWWVYLFYLFLTDRVCVFLILQKVARRCETHMFVPTTMLMYTHQQRHCQHVTLCYYVMMSWLRRQVVCNTAPPWVKHLPQSCHNAPKHRWYVCKIRLLKQAALWRRSIAATSRNVLTTSSCNGFLDTSQTP